MGPAIEIGRVGQDAADARANREEGLGEGIADGGGIQQLSAVPTQQEGAVATGGTLEPRGPDRQGNQHHKQQRQTPAGKALNAFLHPASHHQGGQQQADQLPKQRRAAATEASEELLGGTHVLGQARKGGLQQGDAGPAHQHGVEGQDPAGGQHKQPAHRLPAPACCRHRSQQGALAGAATQHHFGHQHRQANHQHDQHIQQQKRPAAPLGGAVGKAPKVPQANGTASRCQHKAQTRAPLLPRCHRFSHQPNAAPACQ